MTRDGLARERSRGWTTAIALALCVFGFGGASGQEDPAGQSALDEANGLIAQLVVLDGSLALLQELAEAGTPDDQARVARRIASYAAERRAVVWELAEVADGLRADSLSQQTAAFADSVLTDELNRIETEATVLARQAADLRAAQAGASAASQLESEIRLTALDREVEQRVSDYVDTVELMEQRGIEPPSIVDRLDRFLIGRAELAIAEMDLATEEVETLDLAISTAGADADAEMQLRRQVAVARFDGATARLRSTIDAMDRRGIETEVFGSELLLRSRDFTPESLDVRVMVQLARRFSASITDWLTTRGGPVLFSVLWFVAILFVFRLLAGLARRLTRRAVATSRLKLSTLLQETFVSWAGRVVMILGILIALAQVGINLGPVLAGLGVVGFIVGFALQDTLSNFASGLMILIYRPFDVDDLVEAGGEFGTVSALSLVSTTLLTIDNQRLVVPNSQIWGGVIRNVTAQESRRVDLVFGIGYSDDIPKAEVVLRRIVDEHPLVLEDPEPVVKVHTLGESSVDFVVRPWCKTDDYWDVHWDITRSVKMAFDAEGISIPFPQRDVHIHEAAAD